MNIKFKILASISIVTLALSESTAYAHKTKPAADVVINVVGDVHGERAIKREKLSDLKHIFKGGDLNIFNLETAVTDSQEKVEKAYNFKTDLDFLKRLKSVGLNVASIANNHAYDFGEKGFLDTLNNLKSSEISYVGGGLNIAEAYRGKIFKVKNLKIGLLGFAKVNGGPDSIAREGKPGMTNGYDIARTTSAITTLKAASDVVIVLVHWGEEGSFEPRASDISSAKAWFKSGADIIVGAHTHTLQPVVQDKNTLIAYSMGNFIFYSSHIENRRTGILQIRISAKKKISFHLRPMEINNLTKVPQENSV